MPQSLSSVSDAISESFDSFTIPRVFQKLSRSGEVKSVRQAPRRLELPRFARCSQTRVFSQLLHQTTTSTMTAPRVARRFQPLASRRFPQPRWNSTLPPSGPPQSSNRHRAFYRTFGRPLGQNFLIAVVTFQVIYWSWLKLESLETKKERSEEIQALEGELKGLTKGKPTS